MSRKKIVEVCKKDDKDCLFSKKFTEIVKSQDDAEKIDEYGNIKMNPERFIRIMEKKMNICCNQEIEDLFFKHNKKDFTIEKTMIGLPDEGDGFARFPQYRRYIIHPLNYSSKKRGNFSYI